MILPASLTDVGSMIATAMTVVRGQPTPPMPQPPARPGVS
jgi:hypothetical protein